MHLHECTKIVTENSFMIDVSNNYMSKTHCHPFFELVYVVKGTVIHTLDNRTMIIKSGDYFLINLNSFHGYTALPATTDFEIINCMFMPSFIDPILSSTKTFEEILNNYLIKFGYTKYGRAPTQNVYHDVDNRMYYLAKEMLNEYNHKRKGYEDIIRYFLMTAIIYLVRNEAAQEDSKVDDVTRYIKEYVANNYNKSICLSDICQNTDLTLSNISKIFTRKAGMNFRDYLQKIRIEKACQLLEMTNKNISEISSLVGYSDPAFFYRAFKNVLGLTPLEYRRHSKNK